MTSGTVVAAADVIALGLMSRLQHAGFRVPEDFRIIGFDGVGVSRLAHPSLTTVRQPIEQISATVLELVLAEPAAFASTAEERHTLFRPQLIIGDSSPQRSTGDGRGPGELDGSEPRGPGVGGHEAPGAAAPEASARPPATFEGPPTPSTSRSHPPTGSRVDGAPGPRPRRRRARQPAPRAGPRVVLVLHDLSPAVRYADHLVAMRDGRIVAQGPAATVITTELLPDVFGLRAAVLPDPVSDGDLVVPIGTRRTQRWPSSRAICSSRAMRSGIGGCEANIDAIP